MPQETMTPKERWLAVLRREKPDRVPMDYWSTPEFSAKLVNRLGFSPLSEHALVEEFTHPDDDDPFRPDSAHNALLRTLQSLHVDFLVSVGPAYVGPTLPADTSVFGCTYRDINYGSGVYSETVTHPLARYDSVEEIEANYTWPNPDWWDYSRIPQRIVGWEDYAIRGGGSEPFLTYKDLRGDVQALMDLVEHPDIVEYCMGKLFDLAYQNTLRVYETIPGKVNVTYVAEDMGGQDSLMISVKHIRRFLLPGMKRIIDLAHEAGAYVFHHNDGACRAILPDMIGLGIDVLNPVQWRSKGMGREGLKADFGSQICFHGAVDNQYTLPFGTVDEVRQEVIDNLRILGAGGGYIIAPCHNIQPLTPLENVLAMYQSGYENGWT